MEEMKNPSAKMRLEMEKMSLCIIDSKVERDVHTISSEQKRYHAQSTSTFLLIPLQVHIFSNHHKILTAILFTQPIGAPAPKNTPTPDQMSLNSSPLSALHSDSLDV